MIRTYHDLQKFETFKERYDYLKLHSKPGESTFGFDRYLNQLFYTSRQWKQARDRVIVRDDGCDLGVPGYDIYGRIVIHHMNPIIVDDLTDFNEDVLNIDYLITTTHKTHNAIHYGVLNPMNALPKERTPGDTKLW